MGFRFVANHDSIFGMFVAYQLLSFRHDEHGMHERMRSICGVVSRGNIGDNVTTFFF